MGRLIDADDLHRKLFEYGCHKSKMHPMDVMKMINEQPTAYDVDKVVGEITEKAERYCNSVSCEDNPRGLTYLCTDCEHHCLTKGIIEAVRKGGVDE